MPHRRKSQSQTQLLELVDLIYQTALAPEVWPSALEQLSAALTARIVWQATFTLDSSKSGFGVYRTWGPKDHELMFHATSCQPSPWTAAAQRCSPDTVRRTSDFLPLPDLARHDFYHDFVVPLAAHYCMGCHKFLAPIELAVYTSYRSLEDGDFTDEEVALFQRLTPHLHRAELLALRLGDAQMATAAALETLHRLTIGVILLDRRGEPVFINHSAEELLAAADGLCLVDGELRTWLDAETRALARLMQNAAGAETVDAGGELSITRPSGQRPLGVLVAPLRPEGLLPGARPPTAVVFLADPEQRTEGREAGLARLFGLTPAEATVAVEVARGGGLQEVADSLSVSLNTVRSQLAQVLAKTRTRRQAELVRLLAGGIAQVRPPATAQQPVNHGSSSERDVGDQLTTGRTRRRPPRARGSGGSSS